MKVRYTYRLRPGPAARRYLVREFGACRFVWNELVAQSQAHYEAGIAAGLAGAGPVTFGYKAQDKSLTRLRATMVDAETGEHWLAAGSSVVQQQMVRDFAAARAKALMDRVNKVPVARRRALPRFKKRSQAPVSLNYTQRGFALRPDPSDGRVRLVLPGKVKIPVVWSRELPSHPKSVRVYQDTVGHWYASFVVDDNHPVVGPVGDGVAIGVDWGVTETATTARVDLVTGAIDETTVFDLPHRRHGKNAAAELARAQRKVARRRRPKGHEASHGYRLAKFQAAKVAKKVARQRKDDARKWAKALVLAHDHIAVEDFRPRFLAKSTMAAKAADAAIGATKAELIWQAAKAGRDLRLVHPAYTTMDCATPTCGARTKHRLPLGQRTYTCQTCGHTRPRDKNSAAIMVARAGFDPADVEDITPAPAVALALAV